jgi:hypothetical protein
MTPRPRNEEYQVVNFNKYPFHTNITNYVAYCHGQYSEAYNIQ